MQTLEVISINLWLVLISLANLAILYTLVKKFLYKPVKRTIANRQAAIDEQYRAAAEAEAAAAASRDAYAAKLSAAHSEADGIIHDAVVNADRRSDKIVADARSKAEQIVRQGELEAAMEMKKAQESIRREIADVSAAMAEKLLQREMNMDDHSRMIDDFLNEMGEDG